MNYEGTHNLKQMRLRKSQQSMRLIWNNICDLHSKNLAHPAFLKNRVKARNHNSYPRSCHRVNFKVIGCPVAEMQFETWPCTQAPVHNAKKGLVTLGTYSCMC